MYMSRLDLLEKEALTPSDSDRATLAAHLLDSLPAVLSEEDDGLREAERRDSELESGGLGIPWDALRQKIGRQMSLVFHPLVQRDINIALRYYDDEGGRSLGDRFYTELNQKLTEVLNAPERFHVVSGEIRRANLIKFPYHILFRIRPAHVRVLVIRHHRRHPDFGIGRK
jgi:plasmid stabilization system protein ParE